MALNFNSAPFFNDYDETKGFLKILFRPGQAVQARELSQSQDILQNQIGRFGSFIFKSGSQVLGGQLTVDTNVIYANTNPIYNGSTVNLNQFANTIVTDAATRTVRASVVSVAPQFTGSNEPPTLMLKYLTGTTFPDGANVTIESSNSGPFVLLANASSQGTGSIVSINDGVFFLDLNNLQAIANTNANTVPSTLTNAYFVRVPAQTIILDKYDNTPTFKVGLQVSEAIVTEQTDASLLDPALGASSYQGPGAARYTITATLSNRALTSQDDTAFIELLRIVNGQINSAQKTPVLSDINDTLALRTYEQSGSFTVTPFAIHLTDSANNDVANANTLQYTVSLDAGTAYVEGYRYQTISKTVLNAPRARTTVNVAVSPIQTYFGNYLFIDTVNGEFNFSTLPQVDLHCVNSSNVNTVTTFAYANTLIGTAKIRALEYNSAANTANGLTYVFRAHLFDVNTGSIVSTSNGSTLTSVNLGPLFSQSDNAYAGMTITIPFTGDSRLITSYQGSTRLANVSQSWTVQPAIGNTFNLIGAVNSIESIGLSTNSTFITANANINIGSKNQFTAFANVAFTDTNFQPLLFKFPNSTIAQGLSGQAYQYRYRVATGQTLQAGTPLVVNLSVPGDSTAKFAASGIAGADLVTLNDFLLVTNPGGGVSGKIVPMTTGIGRSVTATDTTATFTMAGGDPTFNNVDVFASITTTLGAKTKTLVPANTQIVQVSSGTTVSNATVYLTQGQVYFTNGQTSNIANPAFVQDLYISDAISVQIIDSGAPAVAVSNAMLQAAANNTTLPGAAVDITNNYNFFNGQKDTYYDHATVTLKPGAPAPRGQVLILVNYFSHSTTGSYFTVDSYPTYATIPTYISSVSGSYKLRDTLDFRPRRDDVTLAYTFANSGTILLPEPSPSLHFTTNFAYYLPRIDQLILTKNGDFRILQGDSSLNPAAPKVPSKAMLLYTLYVPPFTFSSSNIVPQLQDNRRYTMSDIGKLDKRISALEYYTALNNLEQNATQQTIVDANGLSRPKNGILVDNFQGSSIADVTNLDYYASIDTLNNEMRPPGKINNIPFVFNSGLSSHYQQAGSIFTLPYNPVTFIDQSTTSRTENLNPFNLTVWNGTAKLNPESDTWVDTTQAPAVTTNLSGSNDAWAAVGQAVNDTRSSFDTVWNSWQTVSAGVTSSQQLSTGPVYTGQQSTGVYIDAWHAIHGASAFQQVQDTILSTTNQTVENQVRTGIQTTVSVDTVTKSLGTSIIDISVIPYMREKYIYVVARSMKPLTQVYAFFDNVNVTNYIRQAGLITFTSNVSFQDTYQNSELIVDTDANLGPDGRANTARILISKDNVAWVVEEHGLIIPGKTYRGSITGKTAVVSAYKHNGGTAGDLGTLEYQTGFTYGTTTLASSTSLVLQSTASITDNFYNGQTVNLVDNTGEGFSSVITTYTGNNRLATVSGWQGSLVAAGILPWRYQSYGVGPLVTDNNGDLAVVFHIPSNSRLKFPTGTSVFMLTDSATGDITKATTKAQDTFTAQGTLDTTQQNFVTTRVPVLTTQTVSQAQTVVGSPVTTSQVIATNVIGYVDPLAQNFLIDNNVYPDGVFITSVRVCFFSKDSQIPVTLQIRPTNNGFPDSSVIIPFSQVIKIPSQVTVSQTPSLDDASTYTEFVFDAPIFLSPGSEYSIVLLSNSNQYNIYTAVVGDKFLGSDRLISTPPYLGVFFKSQNSSTWTPFQGENLMFRINKASFDNSLPLTLVVNAPTFIANSPTTLVPSNEIYLDAMYLTSQDQVLKDTTLSYGFRATSNTSRVLDTTYTNIPTKQNAYFTDRKALLPAGNSFYIQTSGVSISKDVSPIIDIERYSITAIADQINNGGISNNNITITNPGQGYNIANTNLVTVTGGNGSGAQLSINSVDANGNITGVVVNSSGSGSGYTGNIVGTITTSGYSPTKVATIAIGSETNPSGGNFTSRYITRIVTLAPGMDAGDLQVTFDAHKPVGTQIYTYYKILSAEDTTSFANRPYVLMSLDSTDAFSTGPDDFTEYTYVGSVDSFGNPIRNISYGTFTTFKSYAVKIVLASSNPAIVPRVSNLRIIAMPASS